MKELLKSFADDCFHLKRKTIEYYEYRISDFICWIQENTTITDLNNVESQHFKRYFTSRKDVFSWYTLKNTKTSLGLFFDWLEVNEYIKINVFRNTKIKLPTRPKKALEITSEAVAKKIIRKINQEKFSSKKNVFAIRDSAIIILLWTTGVRREEVYNLKIKDVDFGSRLVHIVNGKYAKDRHIPFQQPTEEALMAWLTIRNDLPTDSEYFFIGLHATRDGLYQKLGGNSLNSICRKWSKAANIPSTEKTNPHAWRRGYATQCLVNGMDIESLSAILGHESPEVTLRYYIQIKRQKSIQTASKYTPDF